MPSTFADYYGTAVLAVLELAGAFARVNKDIDLSYDPGSSWGLTTYQIRRGWDYLVRHLQGGCPPNQFILNGTAMWDSGALEKLREEVGSANF